MKFIINFLVLYSIAWRTVEAICANGCSGHGTCGQNNVCTCFSGWNGGAADCSYRTCPSGPAWADKAYATDQAHLPALCSNAGICDYTTGKCDCFPGFTGSACQRSVCPNDCSGHGSCMSIADVSYFYGADYKWGDFSLAGDSRGPVYTNWDKDSITMCVCDASFFGADCSLRMCPKGDDPLTINQNYRQIMMRIESPNNLAGAIGLEFQGVTTFINLSPATDSDCKRAVESSPQIGTVACTFAQITSKIFTFTFAFFSWPMPARSNNLYSHNGNPAITDFYCDVSQVTGGVPSCTFTDVQSDNIREWVYCSNRGTCDFSTGACACNPGFGGGACSNSTYFAGITGSNAAPGLQVLVDGPDYTGDALQIRSAKSAASDFYLIDAVANNQRVFFVRGDGAVGFTSLITPGGATISAGGLVVAKSGATITTGGLTVSDGGASISNTVASSQPNAASITAASVSLPPNFSVLDIFTQTANQHNLISASNSYANRVFTVQSTGRVDIFQGGLYITAGGMSINSGGAAIYGGITVQSAGLVVNKMGISVNEGGIVTNSGVHVTAGGIQISSGGLKIISAGAEIVSGGLRVNSGMAQFRAGMSVTGGLTVQSGGLSAAGGLTVQSNGLTVTAGGVLVTDGGLTVSNTGLRVTAGGIGVTGGITVSDTGITLSGTTLTTAVNTAYTSGGSQYVLTTSDRRLKERLTAVDESLLKLSKLKGVYYYWTKSAQQTHGYDHRRHLGFLAQDVFDAVPEAVTSILNEQYMGVDYPSIVPLITAGVNELAEQNRVLIEQVARLSSRVEELELAQRKRLQAEKEHIDMDTHITELLARVETLEKKT